MGSIPDLSILKGASRRVPERVVLHRLFERNAHHPATADNTALIFQNESNQSLQLKYWELDEAANRLARGILRVVQEKGGRFNRDGDNIVAVSIPPSDTLVVTLLAVWKAGAAYLPLDVQAPANRVRHILDEAKPLLVISHRDDCAENELFENINVVSTGFLEKEAAKYSSKILQENEMFRTANEPSMAIVLYTSGSTGIPKGVRISHRAVFNRLQWQWNTFPYAESERVCAFKTALTFVDSVSEIWAPLLSETPKSILVVPKEVTKDPERLIAELERHRIERLVLVPSLLRAILLYLELDKNNARRDDQLLKHLKLWVCSGEPLVPSLVKHFFNHFEGTEHVICNFYGSTEVMGDVTFEKMSAFKGDLVPIGLPVDNSVVYLLDKKLNPVPSGQIGEIYCSGLNLASGYVNNRDADRFIANPHTVEPQYALLYKTGDYGKIVDGTLVYEGRTDSQVKVRGHRVDMSEIENSLHKINGVDKVAVLCYKPGEVDQAILAFVTLQDPSWTAGTIEEELSKTLPPYSLPTIRVLDKIPLLNNGKTDRQFLLKAYGEEVSEKGGKRAPVDLTGVPENKRKAAQCLFETVASILGGSLKCPINKDVGFFELGGNSLNSIYTITKLRDQGFVIGITEFLSSKTLGDILDKIRTEDEDSNILADENNNKGKTKYEAEILDDKHREAVTEIIADSFCEKGDLEQCIQPRIERDAYIELLDVLWVHLVEKGLSFAVKSAETGEYVGASLSFDVHDEPPVEITSRLNIIFEFLEFLEGPIRETKLPQGKGKILHGFMMGTHKKLDAKENIEVIQFMEEEEVRLARRRGFESIFTSNSSPLTQQLGSDVFDYEVLLDYQVNKFVAEDGSKPFGSAPDTQTVSCSLKRV
nr:PREDICTED: uncharacterized protein LOC109034831 [Bemisia tabaci]